MSKERVILFIMIGLLFIGFILWNAFDKTDSGLEYPKGYSKAYTTDLAKFNNCVYSREQLNNLISTYSDFTFYFKDNNKFTEISLTNLALLKKASSFRVTVLCDDNRVCAFMFEEEK